MSSSSRGSDASPDPRPPLVRGAKQLQPFLESDDANWPYHAIKSNKSAAIHSPVCLKRFGRKMLLKIGVRARSDIGRGVLPASNNRIFGTPFTVTLAVGTGTYDQDQVDVIGRG